MRLDQTLGRASAHQVVVRVQLRGPNGVEVRECPAPEFEPSDRGVAMGAVFIPWARIYRYDTIVEQGFIPEGHEAETRTLQRVVFEDESGVARTIEVPLDRYETGPWNLTLVIERTVDRQRGRLSIRKVCIPWGRVIESERVFTVPDAQAPADDGTIERPTDAPDPTIREWFQRTGDDAEEDLGVAEGSEPEGDAPIVRDAPTPDPQDAPAGLDESDDGIEPERKGSDDEPTADRSGRRLADVFEIPDAEPEPERTG